MAIQGDSHLVIVFRQCPLEVGLGAIGRDLGIGEHLLLGEHEERVSGAGAEFLQFSIQVLHRELIGFISCRDAFFGGIDLGGCIAYIDYDILLDTCLLYTSDAADE